MDVAQARAFVSHHHRGVLVTRRRDGRAQSSPVLAAIDSSERLVVSSREAAYKVRNLRRDGEVTYCGFTDHFFGAWVQIDGNAEIVSLPAAMDGLVDYYRSVSGEHEDWDAYREAMRREARVLVAITIERAGPNRSG